MEELWQLLLQADEKISDIVLLYGTLTYVILFAVIFTETGFVVLTFFPGDGLLFACGVLASTGELSLVLLLGLLSLATFLGNSSNYLIGKYIGINFLERRGSKKNKRVSQAFRYFEKHQGKAVFFSRYIPFLRSLIPFVAGLSKMKFGWYSVLNILGGISWIATYLLLGYFLGSIPLIQKYYGLVLSIALVIMAFSILLNFIKWIFKNKFAADANQSSK